MATFDDARIAEILMGRRAVRVYPLPFAREIEVGVRLLSEQEIDEARLEAQRYVKKVNADVSVDGDFIERETRRQIVWRAFVDAADKERPFFASDALVRGLDAEMVTALFELYYEHQSWVSPLRNLDADGVKELADALGKASNAPALLLDCDSATLRSLCISMALALRST